MITHNTCSWEKIRLQRSNFGLAPVWETKPIEKDSVCTNKFYQTKSQQLSSQISE